MCYAQSNRFILEYWFTPICASKRKQIQKIHFRLSRLLWSNYTYQIFISTSIIKLPLSLKASHVLSASKLRLI